MFERSSGTRRDGMAGERAGFSPQGRQVRMVVLTWPALAFLGATVGTAACLFNDGECPFRAAAREALVGDAGSVKSISIRPDGKALASVGSGGSLLLFDLGERRDWPTGPQGPV